MRCCPAHEPGCLRTVQSTCSLVRPKRSRRFQRHWRAQPGLETGKATCGLQPRPGCRLIAAATEPDAESGEDSEFDVEAMLQVAAALPHDPERPSYHLMSQKGWLNVRFWSCRDATGLIVQNTEVQGLVPLS